MNDAARGAIIVGALFALYLALRLAFVHLRKWRTDRRRHVMSHVFHLTLALVVTAGLIVYTVGDATGSNAALTWWEYGRVVQVSLICAGLRPLWTHHRTLAARRSEQP